MARTAPPGRARSGDSAAVARGPRYGLEIIRHLTECGRSRLELMAAHWKEFIAKIARLMDAAQEIYS